MLTKIESPPKCKQSFKKKQNKYRILAMLQEVSGYFDLLPQRLPLPLLLPLQPLHPAHFLFSFISLRILRTSDIAAMATIAYTIISSIGFLEQPAYAIYDK